MQDTKRANDDNESGDIWYGRTWIVRLVNNTAHSSGVRLVRTYYKAERPIDANQEGPNKASLSGVEIRRSQVWLQNLVVEDFAANIACGRLSASAGLQELSELAVEDCRAV